MSQISNLKSQISFRMSTLLRVCIKYALVAGALALVMAIITFYIGQHPILIAPYIDFRILLFGVFIFFSLREFRDFYQNGELYFFQAMIGSGIVVIIASVISTAGLYGFGLVEPDFLARYIEGRTLYLKTFSAEDIERIGKEIFESNLKALPATNMIGLASTYFGQGLGIGFFVSIILSVIVRRQPKN